MDTGIIKTETMEQYHASGAYGSGAIKDYINDPVGFKRGQIDKNERFIIQQTQAMLEGSVLHAMVEGCPENYFVNNVDDIRYNKQEFETFLENPSVFELPPGEFITPSGNLSTKAAAKQWKQMVIEAGHIPCTFDEYEILKNLREYLLTDTGTMRQMISPAMWNDCEFLYEQLMANTQAKEYIETSEHEVTARMYDKQTGLYMQSRYDLYRSNTLVADVKKTVKPINKFHYQARELMYDVQCALYLMTFFHLHPDADPSKVEFWFIVVSKTKPYQVQCMMAPPTMIEEGWNKVEHAMNGISAKNFESLLPEHDLLDW